jgi:para-nitrobenzyl esterase
MITRVFNVLTVLLLSTAMASCQVYIKSNERVQTNKKPTSSKPSSNQGSSNTPSSSPVEIAGADYQTPPLAMRNDPSPFQIPSNFIAKHTADLKYGQFSSNVFDIWLAKSEEPTALVIFYHGGGFKSGDKSIAYGKGSEGRSVSPKFIEQLLSEGISFASINYRLLEQNEKEGVLKSLNDSKRALQYIKYHAEELNIDPDRIALTGSSAGAGTCLWLAVHDDMKKTNGSDPVAAMSTRVSAIALNESQSTYDIDRWFGDVFPMEGSLKSMQGSALGKKLLPFYGVTSVTQLETPEMENYRRNVDMLSMISSDDPPIWLRNGEEFKEKQGRPGNLLHSPYHALAIKKAVDNVGGIENYIYVPAANVVPDQEISMGAFLISHLNN